MKRIDKETIDKAVKRLRDKFSHENLIKISKFSHLSPEKHAQMLIFAEALALSLLDSYLRINK
jgi:hypothetical protein